MFLSKNWRIFIKPKLYEMLYNMETSNSSSQLMIQTAGIGEKIKWKEFQPSHGISTVGILWVMKK